MHLKRKSAKTIQGVFNSLGVALEVLKIMDTRGSVRNSRNRFTVGSYCNFETKYLRQC